MTLEQAVPRLVLGFGTKEALKKPGVRTGRHSIELERRLEPLRERLGGRR